MRGSGRALLFAFAFATACGVACDQSSLSPSACPAEHPTAEPTSPVDHGARAVAAALTRLGSAARVEIYLASDPRAAGLAPPLDARPESFAILPTETGVTIVGRDEVGAMYGALEVAERLGAHGESALRLAAPIYERPDLPTRGANSYIVVPDHGEACWYFRDASFWTEYLDLLARARMNFLDLHAMYYLDNTLSPNALLYFAKSASHPEIGIDPAEREANQRMLATIVEMARVRGIRVGLLTARIDLSPTADPAFVSPLDDAALRVYTREAVADLARHTPGLARLGVRIGESTEDAKFFADTFVAGLRDAGPNAPGLYARTWLTTKPEMLDLLGATGRSDVPVEVKYAGEQMGTPYVLGGGGAFASEHFRPSYLYEDYLEEPAPYDFLFQVWASSTYRFFRYASYERTASLVRSLRLSPRVGGFSLQASHTYNRQRDYWHARPGDRYSEWSFRRDELEYLLFGRLGYDATTSVDVFRDALGARGAGALWDAEQAATDLVGWIQEAHGCGADSRDFAAQLEWTGSTRYWALPAHQPPGTVPGNCGTGYHGPYDAFAVASAYDAAGDLLSGVVTTRLSPRDVAQRVLDDAARARRAGSLVLDPANVEARDMARECVAEADLGDYFGHKLRAATALAVYEGSTSQDYLAVARAESDAADAAWRDLARHTEYVKPFEEGVRMGYLGLRLFHWAEEIPYLDDDPRSIDALVNEVSLAPPKFTTPLPPARAWLDATRAPAPRLVGLTIDPPDPHATSWSVRAHFDPPLGVEISARVLWKPFRSTEDFRPEVAHLENGEAVATVQGDGRGGLFAVELVDATPSDGSAPWGRRYPDVLEGAPYVPLPP